MNAHTASGQRQPDLPLWTPNSGGATALARFAKSLGRDSEDYASLWRWSVDDLPGFWSAVWDFCGVIGEKGSVILENEKTMPGASFFPESRLNYAENMLRRRDNTPALIFRDEKERERTVTFAELHDDVSRWQQAFATHGIRPGDRIAACMPNMPETIAAMLAAASIGAIWSSASPDFGAQGLIDRFGQIEPAILIAADGYYYGGKTIDCRDKIATVQSAIKSLKQTIIVDFIGEKPLTGQRAVADFIGVHKPHPVTFTRLPFNHPLFLLYSSGTTGVPKCIVHGHGGTLIQHLKEHRLHCDIREGDRVFYFTTCGWMMWNWLASVLASGATLLLYDGSPFYPDGHVLWDFTARHKATLFGTSAKYIDALKANNIRPRDHHNLSALRTLTSTGSPLVHESFDFVYDAIRPDLHLASISGGTDIVSCFVLGNPVSPVWRGEIQGPGLGMAVDVLDDQGRPLPPGAGSGELVCNKPFPSMPVMFWNDPEGKKYRAAYFDRFPGVWCHGDWIERTIHDGFIIHGRSDATLNPGGVRIGTAEIYRIVEQMPDIAESLAVGQDWDNDVRVILFVRLKEGYELDDDLKNRIKKSLRAGASPRHVPAKIIAVADIPRTKSNKIVELAVRDVIHGRTVRNVEALANPQALDLYKNLPELHD